MDLASASCGDAGALLRCAVCPHVDRAPQYSPENQLDIIRQYAVTHNMEIVREYSDHGRSGLNIAGREGLN